MAEEIGLWAKFVGSLGGLLTRIRKKCNERTIEAARRRLRDLQGPIVILTRELNETKEDSERTQRELDNSYSSPALAALSSDDRKKRTEELKKRVENLDLRWLDMDKRLWDLFGKQDFINRNIQDIQSIRCQ